MKENKNNRVESACSITAEVDGMLKEGLNIAIERDGKLLCVVNFGEIMCGLAESVGIDELADCMAAYASAAVLSRDGIDIERDGEDVAIEAIAKHYKDVLHRLRTNAGMK